MKNFKILLCVILIASLFSGCMNTQHLKDLVIVEGMGIDTADSQVQVFVQTLNVAMNSTSEGLKGNNTIVTDNKSDTVMDAVSGLSKSISKRLFFGQNKLVVFGRDVAEQELENRLDYFLRSTDSRSDVAVCVSQTKAKDIIESDENDALVPCESILHLIENSERHGLGVYVTTNDLLNAYSDKTSDIYLPVLEKKDGDKSVKIKGIGMFSDMKLAYVTDAEQTLGFLVMQGTIDNAVMDLKDEKHGNIGVEISDVRAEKYVTVENGNIVFNVKIKMNMVIDEVEKGMLSSLNKDSLERITQAVQNKINSMCNKLFDASKANKSDCLKVGKYLAKYDSEIYNSVSDKWMDYYPSVNLRVSSDANLKRISDNSQLE